MNHKILTNQIMLSLTEGYLSPCPSLSLGSFPLPPSNKESLGQITPLCVVTFGAYIWCLDSDQVSPLILVGPRFRLTLRRP
jgi:hypothetical protein